MEAPAELAAQTALGEAANVPRAGASSRDEEAGEDRR